MYFTRARFEIVTIEVRWITCRCRNSWITMRLSSAHYTSQKIERISCHEDSIDIYRQPLIKIYHYRGKCKHNYDLGIMFPYKHFGLYLAFGKRKLKNISVQNKPLDVLFHLRRCTAF